MAQRMACHVKEWDPETKTFKLSSAGAKGCAEELYWAKEQEQTYIEAGKTAWMLTARIVKQKTQGKPRRRKPEPDFSGEERRRSVSPTVSLGALSTIEPGGLCSATVDDNGWELIEFKSTVVLRKL